MGVMPQDYKCHLLLPREDVLVEVVLDLFISYIDAQLLKWIPWKVFKPKDVQKAHRQWFSTVKRQVMI